MPSPIGLLKRMMVGRPFRSDRLSETLLPKRIALPVFASDALSSVAYAPAEIFATLSVAGLSVYQLSPWIALAIAVVFLAVVASNRQNVRAYPSGGGDFEVTTTNLGPRLGMVVASALLVDYVLTVAVSVASGVENAGSAIPWLNAHKVGMSLVIVALLTAANLRGVRESGLAFAIPSYAFMISILGMVGYGFFRIVILNNDVQAESAGFELRGKGSFVGIALVFLMMRAFSSGSAALTGVEAISNGVPAFRKPKSKNAATTLALLGALAISMMMGIVLLAGRVGLKYADDPAKQLGGMPHGYQQKTVVGQLAEAVFGSFHLAFYVVIACTALILLLAANTAFNGFPVLGSILAQRRYLPRQLHTRGDRLAFSNGILFLAILACALLVGFHASASALVHLYIVGVFVAFTFSQMGMVRHWARKLKTERDVRRRRSMKRSQAINLFGFCMTATVLLIVILTKFLQGAWIAIFAMAIIYLIMVGIRRHYDRVSTELTSTEQRPMLPARNHAVVLVSILHLPAMRALAYARATHPDTLTAITVSVDRADTEELQREWDERGIPITLTVVDSPYREITRPIIEYVKNIRRRSPRDVVTVFIPEYVVGRWWENLLHNQSALRLKTRLRFVPGIMVTSVPWQLRSSERRQSVSPWEPPGDVRRGVDRTEREPSANEDATRDRQTRTS